MLKSNFKFFTGLGSLKNAQKEAGDKPLLMNENYNGFRAYGYCNDWKDVYDEIYNKNNNSFLHEVFHPDKPKRPLIDIDMKEIPEGYKSSYEVIQIIQEILISEYINFFNINREDVSTIISDNTRNIEDGKKKYSYHITFLPFAFKHAKDEKLFMKSIIKNSEILSYFETLGIIDTNIYRTFGSLRLPGCYKVGTDKPMKILGCEKIPTYEKWIQSIGSVKNINPKLLLDCKLNLKENSQKFLDIMKTLIIINYLQNQLFNKSMVYKI